MLLFLKIDQENGSIYPEDRKGRATTVQSKPASQDQNNRSKP
jgi:hypothetical protein